MIGGAILGEPYFLERGVLASGEYVRSFLGEIDLLLFLSPYLSQMVLLDASPTPILGSSHLKLDQIQWFFQCSLQ